MQSPARSEPKMDKLDSKMEKFDSKNEHEDEVKNQGSRRSRKDVDGRDFICGCGKRYLSYPALYTHIKTKHDGKEPEGTQKNTGAPSKKSKSKVEEDHISEMVGLLSADQIKVLTVVDEKLHGSTPLPNRINKHYLSKDLVDVYHNMMKSSNPIRLSKESSLEQYLVAYLVAAGEHVTEKLHEKYQRFAKSFKECYYSMGEEIYQKCFSKKGEGLGYLPEFKVEKVKYAPIICDFYIRFFLEYEYPDLNVELTELILVDFCTWLRSRKSTYVEVILNRAYCINKPLQFEQSLPEEAQESNRENPQSMEESLKIRSEQEAPRADAKIDTQKENKVSNGEVHDENKEQQGKYGVQNGQKDQGEPNQRNEKMDLEPIAEQSGDIARSPNEKAESKEQSKQEIKPTESIQGEWSLAPQVDEEAAELSQDIPDIINPAHQENQSVNPQNLSDRNMNIDGEAPSNEEDANSNEHPESQKL